jgi:glycine cleavage system H protein
VIAVNGDLDANPDLLNSDPYGAGWLLELQLEEGTLDDGLGSLMEPDAYRDTLTE